MKVVEPVGCRGEEVSRCVIDVAEGWIATVGKLETVDAVTGIPVQGQGPDVDRLKRSPETCARRSELRYRDHWAADRESGALTGSQGLDAKNEK